MSLVVAMIEGDRLHACADLRVIKPESRPADTKAHSPNYFNGVMKIVPVSKNIAIAYAGTVPVALNIIREVHKLKLLSNEIAQKIQQLLALNGDVFECDFLVIDAQNMEIHKIKNGSLEIIRNGRTWIGDIDAYNLFQEKLEENGYNTAPNPIAKSSAMMNSLDAVIEDSSIENVGEFPISIFNHKGEIQQSVAFAALGSGGSFSGDAIDDTMIINLTVPVEHGVAALGFYLNKFKKGALYLPLVQDEPILINGDTVGAFRAKVQAEFDIELLGGGFE
jgi:hypothetical protein